MILLTTLNARYAHASLGLRYLLANMGELHNHTRLLEFIIQDRPADIAETLLSHQPKIIGIGVYIWNARECLELVSLLKQIAPEVIIVLGGPEVSHEWESQAIFAMADHLITGSADLEFPDLCRRLMAGETPPKLIHAETPPLDGIELPYRLYDDQDVAHRLLYVEASRGCPFKCEFCLSALDKTAWPFDLERFLDEMNRLYARGARQFKFVDRTFNLNTKTSLRILEFFLERLDERLFLHFEIIPDHLPDALKAPLQRFPPGTLQFEVGIQTFNPEVQSLISRRQDNQKSAENLRWLRDETKAHIHADLIVGLPGENLNSIGEGFDRLVNLGPHEIQVGILKRLNGTPIIRHSEPYRMRYSPFPPYNVVSTADLDFHTLQRLGRFARYWDLVGNSGRFKASTELLLGEQPFKRFLEFSDWLYARIGKTHQIALERLFDNLYLWLVEQDNSEAKARAAIKDDFLSSGARSVPRCLQEEFQGRGCLASPKPESSAPARQARHMR